MNFKNVFVKDFNKHSSFAYIYTVCISVCMCVCVCVCIYMKPSLKFPILSMHFQNHSMDLLSRKSGVQGKNGMVYKREMAKIGPGLKTSMTKIDNSSLRLGNNLFKTDHISISMSHFPKKSLQMPCQ